MAKVTKSDQKNFLVALQSAAVEKDVENAYRTIFEKYYNANFTSPHSTDGYLEPDTGMMFQEKALRLLLEIKWQKNLATNNDRIKILAQAIYYLKRFEQSGELLPNVIMGGDENEMFTIYAPKLYKYLDEDYDWSIAPSNVWVENEQLYRALKEDDNVHDIHVFKIDSSFDIDEVFESINSLREIGEFKKMRVDEANLRKVFDEFIRLVFGGDNWLTGVKKIGADEAVSIFVQSVLGSSEIYLHPNKSNILVIHDRHIRINGAAYNAFFSRYDRKYTTKERDLITSIADQLIEEIKRRFHGDFWTPTIWANRAIQMITDDLGPDWREKYVVWDPAAGTKNLTRDYHFAKLYSSTLHQSEIDMARQYNKNATTFQYDFLNDDIDVNPNSDPRDLKMPTNLFKALKNNDPIIFYTNPPYGQGGGGLLGHASKSGQSQTRIGAIMNEENLGHAAAELYTQFIYRVQKLSRDFNLTNVFFFFFNKGFLVSPAFEKFTDQMLDQFKFNGGFMLNAGEFQGTSSAWGIIFSNFQIKKDGSPRQNEFELSIEKSAPNVEIGTEKICDHTLMRVIKKDTINAWLNEIKLPKTEFNNGSYPQLAGAFNVSYGTTPSGRLYGERAIGYLVNHGIAIQGADRDTWLVSSAAYKGHGSSVSKENFEWACVTFAIKKSILPDASWINDKDVFRRPSDAFQNSPQWREFVRDCVVFSLFHRSSYQTSLRDFEYNNVVYDVVNEWFFMSRDQIIELAEKYDLPEIIDDARSSSDRFVYKYLHGDSGRTIELSDEARELLKLGKRLVEVTFAKRYLANEEQPNWHLMTWDAGYYQAYKITTLFKSEFADLMTEFNAARTKLETKIRKQVYKDGILEK